MSTDLHVKLSDDELAGWDYLHSWLTGTKAGQHLMARMGLDLIEDEPCEASGTRNFQVPALMVAVRQAAYKRGVGASFRKRPS